MSFRASDHRNGRRNAPDASDRNRFGFFQPPKKNLNLGVHPRASSVGGGCYNRGVNEASAHLSDGHLAALAAAASMFEWPLPRERDEAVCCEPVRAAESLLVRVGRCQGALDVTIGEGRHAPERLGMGVRAVEQRAALERRLYELPSLRQAMVERRLSYEKARLIASPRRRTNQFGR